jgi:hypothetical protein
MGCCTSLLYGLAGASKNTVKGRLTLILRTIATGTLSVTAAHLEIGFPGHLLIDWSRMPLWSTMGSAFKLTAPEAVSG